MIISIASGKGGTGKTTLSTNLAASLDTPVTFLDCDVEEPNAHIFLKPKIRESREAYAVVPTLNSSSCDACGQCVDLCNFSALTLIGNDLLLFNELCHSCGGCFLACPNKALEEGKRQLGVIESGTTQHIHFAHGVLRVGEAMSPPLIKQLRKEIIADQDTIIDAPPGTSCPVITAIHDTDYVVLVTEPTPFGLHDLILAHQTVKELGIPCGIVINKADIGDAAVQEYARQQNIPILLQIPFSRQIATAYSSGQLFSDILSDWRKTFSNLYKDIKNHLNEHRQDHERVCSN